MTLKIYKPVLFIAAMLILAKPGFAQDEPDTAGTNVYDSKAFNKSMKVKVKTKHLEMALDNLGDDLNASINGMHLERLGSIISSNVNNIVHSVTVSIGDNDSDGEVMIIQSGSAEEKIKTYSKSYSVDANDRLEISNKYGRVNVNTWNKNEVKVDVQIKGDASDNETAQKMIDAISISDNKSGDVVSFSTNFGNGSSSIWNNLFNNMNDHHKVEVNYTVYMPSTMSLSLSNKYGAVVLPSLSGKVSIDNSYGSLTAKALTNTSNEFNVRYYEVNIEELAGGSINLGYGSLKLGNVGRLEANVSYAPIDIGKLTTSGSINAKYGGGIKINEISKGLKSLDINGKYSSVNIGLRGDESFDFDITVRYGSFNYDDNRLKVTSKSPDDSKGFHPTKSYRGYMGNSNSNNKITINSTYQSVKIE
ncbi:hypothetical protein ACPPVU_01525 [Mucilaginibacter sp. McL0603]|uniref:hypothetical protein n=1 Tax=Mucilaginibacter sp. McL0603 TaxID=3415670 RepID=UPI003CEB37A8